MPADPSKRPKLGIYRDGHSIAKNKVQYGHDFGGAFRIERDLGQAAVVCVWIKHVWDYYIVGKDSVTKFSILSQSDLLIVHSFLNLTAVWVSCTRGLLQCNHILTESSFYSPSQPGSFA